MRILFAALAASTILFAAPAHAAVVHTSVNICAELRSGVSLASIESTLTASGYSERDAGAFTGAQVRDHCPDQRANVVAQVKAAGA